MRLTVSPKPVELEAFQITPETRKDRDAWPDWLKEAWERPNDELGALWPQGYPIDAGDDNLILRVRDGTAFLSWGDWIIRYPDGRLAVRKPGVMFDAFEAIDGAIPPPPPPEEPPSDAPHLIGDRPFQPPPGMAIDTLDRLGPAGWADFLKKDEPTDG